MKQSTSAALHSHADNSSHCSKTKINFALSIWSLLWLISPILYVFGLWHPKLHPPPFHRQPIAPLLTFVFVWVFYLSCNQIQDTHIYNMDKFLIQICHSRYSNPYTLQSHWQMVKCTLKNRNSHTANRTHRPLNKDLWSKHCNNVLQVCYVCRNLICFMQYLI